MPAFGIATVTSRPPAQLLARSGDTIQLLNTDPINTVYLGDSPSIQSADGDGISPLGPGASIVFQQTSFDIYGITAPGTSALIAIYPGAASFSQPLKTIVAGTYLLYSGAPAFGNLFLSIASVATVDQFGNQIPQGFNINGLANVPNLFSIDNAAGQTVALIDGNGNITGQTINAGVDVILAGDSLKATLAALPQGIIAQSSIPVANLPAPAVAVSAETAMLELDVTLAANRSYAINMANLEFQTSGVVGRCTARIRATVDGTTPTTVSNRLFEATVDNASAALPFPTIPEARRVFSPTVPTLLRMLLTITPYATTSTVPTIQLIAAGTAPFNYGEGMLFVEDLGPAIADTGLYLGSGTGGGTGPQTKTYTFYPAHSYSYNAGGGLRSQDSTVWQGYGDSFNQTNYFYLDFSAVVAAIPAGATINWVKFRLSVSHTWYNAGASTGMYTATTQNNFATLSAIRDQWTVTAGGTLNHTTVNQIATDLMGAGRWIVFGANPWGSTSASYYFIANGRDGNTADMPQLQINATK